jgi:hypothetical protein
MSVFLLCDSLLLTQDFISLMGHAEATTSSSAWWVDGWVCTRQHRPPALTLLQQDSTAAATQSVSCVTANLSDPFLLCRPRLGATPQKWTWNPFGGARCPFAGLVPSAPAIAPACPKAGPQLITTAPVDARNRSRGSVPKGVHNGRHSGVAARCAHLLFTRAPGQHHRNGKRRTGGWHGALPEGGNSKRYKFATAGSKVAKLDSKSRY